ncbi:MAG: hypothetical protein ACLRMJ_04725 [Alistipes finegoldii]
MRTAETPARTTEEQVRTTEDPARTAEEPLRTARRTTGANAPGISPRGRSQHVLRQRRVHGDPLHDLPPRKFFRFAERRTGDHRGYNWTSRRGLGVGVVYSGGFISARRGGFERTSRIHYIAPEFVARQRVGRRWLFRENAGIGYGRYIRSYAGLTGSRGGVGIHESVSAEFMLTRFLGLGSPSAGSG